MAVKKRKIDKVIKLKAEVFDMMRKLEVIQNAINETIQIKNKRLKKLHDLESKIANRYARAKALV